MGDSVSRERDIDTRTVGGIEYRIVELHWKYGGVCYDVYRTSDNECISDESTNYIPSDDTIIEMAAEHIAAKFNALDRNSPAYHAKALVVALEAMAVEARERHPAARFLVFTDSDQGPYAVWATTLDAEDNELTDYEPDDNGWASWLDDPARQAAAPFVRDGTEVGPKRAPWEGVEIDIDKVLTHHQEGT